MVFVGQCAVQRDPKVDWMFAVGQHSAVDTDRPIGVGCLDCSDGTPWRWSWPC